MSQLREHVRLELTNLREEVLNSRLAKQLDRLPREHISGIWAEYLHYARRFPDWMLRLARHCDGLPAAQSALEENWFEETGRGNPAESHANKLAQFVRAWGGSDQAPMGKNVQRWIAEIESALGPLESNPDDFAQDPKHRLALAYALGWFGPATEELTSPQYRVFLDGLRQHPHSRQVSPTAFEFFELHIETDVWHSEALWKSIDLLIEGASSPKVESELRDKVLQGAMAGMKAEIQFWSGFEEEFVRGRTSPERRGSP